MARASFNGFRSATSIIVNAKGTVILHQDRNVNEDSEVETEGPVKELLHQEPEVVPLFLRDSSEGKKGDAQDEKDKTGE